MRPRAGSSQGNAESLFNSIEVLSSTSSSNISSAIRAERRASSPSRSRPTLVTSGKAGGGGAGAMYGGLPLSNGDFKGGARAPRRFPAAVLGRLRQLVFRSPTTLPLVSLLVIFAFVIGNLTGRRGGIGLASLTSSSARRHPPFYVPPSLFVPPTPHPPNPSHFPAPSSALKPGQKVPKTLHYVYGLKEVPAGQEPDAFPYYAYLAIRSAMLNIKPEKVYFHHQHIPRGPWFELLKPRMELIKTPVPDSIMGRPLHHFAHKSDVVRLDALRHMGGIYLDIDMFVLRSFDELLMEEMTMGMEASPDSRRTPLEPQGLCNGVIVAAPHADFLDRWRATYESFDESVWADHSVVVPWELARRHPESIQVLSTRAFFWPLWSGEEIQHVHENDDYDFYGTGQFAYHAWESLAMRYLSELNPRDIKAKDTSFHRMVRPFIGDKDEEVYDRWKASKA